MSLSENPYEAPRADLRAVGRAERSAGRCAAGRGSHLQKVILVCILIQIVNIVFQMAVAIGKLPIPQAALMAASIVSLITSVVSAVYVFILAIRIYNTGLGILFGLLALVPCAGLIVLLVVNAKATGILQANGHKVGLMGADLSTIPAS